MHMHMRSRQRGRQQARDDGFRLGGALKRKRMHTACRQHVALLGLHAAGMRAGSPVPQHAMTLFAASRLPLT